jgi:hypothetical protein
MLSDRDATVFFRNAQIGTSFLLRSGRSSSETSNVTCLLRVTVRTSPMTALQNGDNLRRISSAI